MFKKSLVLLTMLFACACNSNNKSSRELLNKIFTNSYEYYLISKGDNRPDFDRRRDSLGLFLVSLHEKIDPVEFQKKAGWSDEILKKRTQLLISKGWLVSDEKGLRPTVFIVSDKQGKELFENGIPLASMIADSIEKEITAIKERFKLAGLASKYNFDSMSFLILSDVLLDNWQLMEMEAQYLKAENRPQRHGKFYYACIEENADNSYEPFGIYGNQFGKINDSTFLSIYGNNRTIVNNRLKNDPAFKDSVLNIALKLTPELNHFFNESSREFRPKLMKILNDQTDYSHTVYEKTGYSKEITFEEFFIWWYHFIYTDVTNILAKRNKLKVPKDGNFYYMG